MGQNLENFDIEKWSEISRFRDLEKSLLLLMLKAILDNVIGCTNYLGWPIFGDFVETNRIAKYFQETDHFLFQ